MLTSRRSGDTDMPLIALVVGGTASLVGFIGILLARYRMPSNFRSLRGALGVTLSCVGGHHDQCHLHLNCPCQCHDDVIHFALATDPQFTPRRD